MSSEHRDLYVRRLSLIAVPIVCTLLMLIVLPVEFALVLVVVLTSSIGIAAYRLENYFATVLSGAFLFRIALISVDSVDSFLPKPPIMSGHNQRAIDLATAWSDGQFLGVLGNTDAMRTLIAHLLAPFYVVLGYSPVAGRLGIAFISLFVGYLVFRLASYVTDRRTTVLTASVILFWPTIVYRSIVIQREIVVVVALLAFLWAAVQWLDAITLRTTTIATLATACIFALRKENLLLIAVMVGFISLVKSRDKPKYLAGLLLLFVPFLAYFSFNFSQFTGYGATLSPAALDAFAYGRAHGDAAYLLGLHYNSWMDVVLYAPIKILYFLYTPFPWHVRDVPELVVGVSALALLVATMGVRRGIVMLQNEMDYLGLLLSYLVTGVVTYSIIEMNYGAAVRRRIQFIPILLLLVVIGLSNVRFDIRWRSR